MTTRTMLARIALSIVPILSTAGCGPVDGADTPPPTAPDPRQMIQNGIGTADVESTHVAIEIWSYDYQVYYTICSGELIDAQTVRTAAHCPRGYTDRQVYVTRSDLRDRIPVVSTKTNPVYDVADLTLATGIPFYPAGPDHKTPIYQGSNASLAGQTVTCLGRGPGRPGATLTRGTFTVTYDDGLNPFGYIHLWPTGSARVTGGDSGGGCFINGELAVIMTDDMLNFGAGVGAESFRDANPLVFSSAGQPAGYPYCIQILEASDPHTWNDNYLCTKKESPFAWSSAGPIDGMKCTQILEAADPDTWNDNYLCINNGNDLSLYWSSAGAISGKQCIQWYEGSDPDTWNDNYLCWY